IRLDPTRPIEIACLTPVKSYLLASIVDGTGKTWLAEEGPVNRPQGIHDIGAPGEWIRRTVWPEQYWPRTVDVRLGIVYGDQGADGGRLVGKSGAQEVRSERPRLVR